MEPWPYADEPEVMKVGWRTIVKKTFIDPDGERMEAYTKDPIGSRSIAVIALTASNMVVVNEMFRPGPERVMFEIPGGGAHADEDLAEAAGRELEEETGYSVGSIESIGSVFKDAWSNNESHYFLARDCKKTGQQKLDKEEFIIAREIPIEQLFVNARSGLMTDTEAVFLAYEKLKEVQNETTN